jgi:hypothetical protein
MVVKSFPLLMSYYTCNKMVRTEFAGMFIFYFHTENSICLSLQWSVSYSHHKLKKLNSVAFSPQANYTDRATAACRRSWFQLLRIKGVAWSAQRIPTAVNFRFSRPEPLLFHSSRSSIILTRLSGPRSRYTTSQKIW